MKEKKKKKELVLNALFQNYCYFSKCTADTYVQAILIDNRRESVHYQMDMVVWSFWMSFVMSVKVK